MHATARHPGTATPTRRLPRLLTAACCAMLALTACSTSDSPRATTPQAAAPTSLEEAMTQYRTVMDDVAAAAVTAITGDTWTDNPNDLYGPCSLGADTDAPGAYESIGTQTPGIVDASQMDAVQNVLWEVGERNGFTPLSTIRDDHQLVIELTDAMGAALRYSSGEPWTNLRLFSSCWAAAGS